MRSIVLNFLNRVEQVLAQPTVTHGTIVALDISVLLWVARLNKFKLDTLLFRPRIQLLADKFRPVVTS